MFTSFDVPLALTKPSNDTKVQTTKRNVRIFKAGTSEEFCEHVHVCEELYTRMGYFKFFPETVTDDDDNLEEEVVMDINGEVVKDDQDKQETSTYEKIVALFTSTLGG